MPSFWMQTGALFACLLPHMRNRRDVVIVKNKVSKTLFATVIDQQIPNYIKTSLLDTADKQLSQNKGDGQNKTFSTLRTPWCKNACTLLGSVWTCVKWLLLWLVAAAGGRAHNGQLSVIMAHSSSRGLDACASARVCVSHRGEIGKLLVIYFSTVNED